MSIKSYFFNSVNEDRPYDADDWGNWFSALVTNGICGAGDLQVYTNSEQDVDGTGAGIVYVSTGSIFLNGHMLTVTDDAYSLVIPASESSAKRYDMIVAQLDVANRVCKLYVKSGKAGSSSTATPSYPTLEQDDLIYELGLAAILVDQGVKAIAADKITDLRILEDYCGISGMRFDGAQDITKFYEGWTAKMNVMYQNLASLAPASQTVSWLQNQLTNLNPSDLTGTLSTSSWTENSDGSYTQTVNYLLMSSTSICYADINLDGITDATTASNIIDNWSYIGRIQTIDGGVTFTCYTTKPLCDIPFIIRMVKYTDLTTSS